MKQDWLPLRMQSKLVAILTNFEQGSHAIQVWLFQTRLFQTRLFQTRLFQTRLFQTRLFQIRLFQTRLFKTRLFQIRLFQTRLFKTRLFQTRLCHKEGVRLYPDGGQLAKSALATIVSLLNSRTRQSSLSAWEIFRKSDQFSG